MRHRALGARLREVRIIFFYLGPLALCLEPFIYPSFLKLSAPCIWSFFLCRLIYDLLRDHQNWGLMRYRFTRSVGFRRLSRCLVQFSAIEVTFGEQEWLHKKEYLMDAFSIICIAFGLAMDAFAVSITSGVTIKYLRINSALTIATCFGSFQAVMPLIGWLAGLSLRDVISGFDHWIAFGLLSSIGFKMIYESCKGESSEREINTLSVFALLILSVATSIDALAVGISLSFLKISIAIPAIIIGIVTFLLTLFGVFIGNRFGHFFENKIEIVGGLILIGIGIKILIEHLV